MANAGHISVGHPVDVASGAVYSLQKDIYIRGKFPLTWERNYHTGLLAGKPSPLGHGWICGYFAQLTRMEKDYHFKTPDGSLEIFKDPSDGVERGKTIRIPESTLELSKIGFSLAVTKWSHETGEVIRFLFQPGRNGQFWPLRSVENAQGHGLELAWDEKGLLKGIRQKLEKRTLAVAHTADGRISALSFLHPDGRSQILTRYEYDSKGRMISASNALGEADRYEYDSENRLTREIIKDGGIFSFKYDDKGRCIRTSGLENYDLKLIRYLTHVNMTEVTDSRGHVTRYQCLPSGQVSLVLDPMGSRNQTEYDDLGRIVKITDPMEYVTAHEYDELGNRCATTDPSGKSTRKKFNEAHLPFEFKDKSGGVWTRKYDGKNRVVEMVNPLGNKWEYRYDENSLVQCIKDPRGFSKFFTYGGSKSLESVTDWSGNTYRYKHDAFGRVTEMLDPLGNATRYVHDGLGRTTAIHFADGTAKTYGYDAGGNLCLKETGGAKHIFRYGPCKRLSESIDPNGFATKYSWGTEPGQLERIANPKNEFHTCVYDAAGRITRETGFDGRTRIFQYNAAGYCIAMTNANGERIRYERDAVGKKLSQATPDGEVSNFTYDPEGRLIHAANDSCELLIERDPIGRITKETQDGNILESRLNEIGHRVAITLGSGEELALTVDGNGHLKSLATGEGEVLSIERNALGMDTGRLHVAGFGMEKVYDSKSRPIAVTARRVGISASTSTATFQNQYAYSEKGRLSSTVESPSVKKEFAYDAGGRLISERESGGVPRDFEYDSAGNRLKLTTGNGHSEAVEITAGNRMVRKGRTSYEYDPDGRLIRKTEPDEKGSLRSWGYTWNAIDRLKSVTDPAGDTWTYSYDPLGRRIAKEGPKATVKYQWDGNTIIREWTEAKASVWVHEPSSFRPLAKLQTGRLLPIVTDHLGSPREIFSGDGKSVQAVRFDAWGNSTAGDAAEIPIRFPGQWFDDESGLHYNRFRYYDPSAGRYISQDPIGIAGGLNAYAYALNPVNQTDPFGLCPLGDLTEEETRQIQQVVDEAGRPLEVVGSAARGERRNPGTDLPFGKGEGGRSDIDYAIPPSSIEYFNDVNAANRLPDVDPHHGLPPSIHSPHDGPSIRFSPGEDPVFIPGAS